jgi:8-oxo-dGTP diphosphatase
MPRPATPALTVDAVITDPQRGVVLICRRHPPSAGAWALPGGFVDVGEACEDACRRETREETGLEVAISGLLGVWSCPDRDPRGHTVSVVYLCRVTGGTLAGADDAAEAAWFAHLGGVSLAFDHAEILASAGFLPGGQAPRGSRP